MSGSDVIIIIINKTTKVAARTDLRNMLTRSETTFHAHSVSVYLCRLMNRR